MIWSSSHRSTIGSHEFDSSSCVEHKSSSCDSFLFKLELFDPVEVIKIYEKSRHSRISSWDSSKSFGLRVRRFFATKENFFFRERIKSQNRKHMEEQCTIAHTRSRSMTYLRHWQSGGSLYGGSNLIGTQLTLWSSSKSQTFSQNSRLIKHHAQGADLQRRNLAREDCESPETRQNIPIV